MNIKKLYILIQGMLYLIFMLIDIINDDLYIISNSIKYTSILLCFMYVCITIKKRVNKRDSIILVLAFLFTLISDWFILIKDSYTYGMFTFVVVHSLYFCRIHLYEKNRFPLLLAFRNIITSVIIISTVTLLNIKLDLLLIVVIVYFTTFLFNIVDGIQLSRKTKNKEVYFFLTGLILFSLCDINVALYTILNNVSLNGALYQVIYQITFLAMWFFYLPSQVILSISALSKEVEYKNNM